MPSERKSIFFIFFFIIIIFWKGGNLVKPDRKEARKIAPPFQSLERGDNSSSVERTPVENNPNNINQKQRANPNVTENEEGNK